jgi:hypothetical protein
MGLEDKPTASRSTLQAIWRSAVLPGWGQHYLGAKARGYVFMTGEAATWGTWGVFKTQESLRRDSYIEMAQVYAGARGDHGDDYWKIVGQHADYLDYNEWLRLEARREYGFGTSDYYAYIDSHQIAPENGWDWNSLARRIDYAEKRKASLNAERRATYTLYALLINRAISIVDAWRLSRTRGEIMRSIEEERSGLDLDAVPTAQGLGWRLSWSRSF